MSLAMKLRAYSRLGPTNIARVVGYKFALRSGLHPVQKLEATVPQEPFFRPSERADIPPIANNTWDTELWWFGKHRRPHPDGPPDWFDNPFSEMRVTGTNTDWWNIPDFSAGDIKGVWELSRFDWVVAWATCAANGDVAALTRLNTWIGDWVRNNPPYKGPNWKCGQEASIRVIHSCVAAKVLGQDHKPEHGLVELVRAHLMRIAPTMSYAIGQQNNHGTSEAAALFIGGTFLRSHDRRANAWISKGRHWLEDRATKLIASDGSFSQQSITYHRMMLDTYSIAEVWRRTTDQKPFSSRLQGKLSAATSWLEAMIIPQTGDAPNLGANDGAHLIPLTDNDYRDFRPSVQLAAALFGNRDAFGAGSWNQLLDWLEVPRGQEYTPPPTSGTFDAGGYHLMRANRAFAVLRYPRYRFRPGQADALHLDFWLDGKNILRDAGSFSYNAEDSSWFRGTAAHNTVQFDNRDQMPRISRFMFGEWLTAEDVTPVKTFGRYVCAGASYTDYKGARHHRRAELNSNCLRCVDNISGEFQSACLRWRLMPGNWQLRGSELWGETVVISILGNISPSALSLSCGSESRYYQHKQDIPVLKIQMDQPGRIETKVTF